MTTRTINLLTLAVLVVLSGIAIAVAPRLFVLFDEAYNLSLIKTLALEGRYASRLAEGYRPFDPAVTTGPTLIVPLALALRLGGATIGIVRAAMVIVFVILLIVALLAARELLGATAALPFLVTFYATPPVLVFGLCVLGDVTAIALGLGALAILNWADRTGQYRMLLLTASGLCLGLAMMAKDIMVLLLSAMVLTWCVDALTQRYGSRRYLLGNLLPMVVGVAMVAGWRGLQFLIMRLSASQQEFHAWSSRVVGMSRHQLAKVIADLFSHSSADLSYNLGYFTPLLVAFVVAIGGFIVLRYVLHASVAWIHSQSLGWRVVASGFIIWFAWYLIISGPEAIHRHLLPGIILGEMLVVALLRQLFCSARLLHSRNAGPAANRDSRSFAASAVLAGVLSILLLWGIGHGIGFTRLYLRSSEDRLAQQQRVAAWIKSNVPTEAALSGWGWFVPWPIAFLADRLPAQADTETMNLEGLTEWFVLIPEVAWFGNLDERLRDFLAHQQAPLVEERLYRIYKITWRPANQ